MTKKTEVARVSGRRNEMRSAAVWIQLDTITEGQL